MATARGDGPEFVVHHQEAMKLLAQARESEPGATDVLLREAQVEATLAVSQVLNYIHERMIHNMNRGG